MRTEAQINAGRENEKKSTGPRTPEGKASQNALKHSLVATENTDAAPPSPPPGRKRYVPAQAPPPIQNNARQDRKSPEDHSRPTIGFRPADPKTQNRKTKLSPP